MAIVAPSGRVRFLLRLHVTAILVRSGRVWKPIDEETGRLLDDSRGRGQRPDLDLAFRLKSQEH
jgi:hypothetical protein